MNKKYNLSTIVGFAFLAPAILLFSLNIIYPTIFSISLSFHKWNGLSPEQTFVGLKNYIHLFHDRHLTKALTNTVLYVIITSGVQICVALCLALLIESVENFYLRVFYRTLIFVPALISPATTSLMWANIFNPEFGLIHQLTGSKISWLGNKNFALYSVMTVNIWKWTGNQVIIYIAALQTIPKDITEVAKLEGINRWHFSTKIVIPMIKVSVSIVAIHSCINGLRTFDLVQIMTHGGPNHASEILGVYMYNMAFEHSKLGYASSIGYVLFAFTLILTFIYFRISKITKD